MAESRAPTAATITNIAITTAPRINNAEKLSGRILPGKYGCIAAMQAAPSELPTENTPAIVDRHQGHLSVARGS